MADISILTKNVSINCFLYIFGLKDLKTVNTRDTDSKNTKQAEFHSKKNPQNWVLIKMAYIFFYTNVYHLSRL